MVAQRVHGSRWFQLTGVEIERLDPKWRSCKSGVVVNPPRDHRARGRGAAGQGDMRMKAAHVHVETRGKDRIVGPLPELK